MAINLTYGEIVPTASNLVYGGMTLFPTFHIEFEVLVTEEGTVNYWASLLQFTVGNNYGSPGDRTPGKILRHIHIQI